MHEFRFMHAPSCNTHHKMTIYQILLGRRLDKSFIGFFLLVVSNFGWTMHRTFNINCLIFTFQKKILLGNFVINFLKSFTFDSRNIHSCKLCRFHVQNHALAVCTQNGTVINIILCHCKQYKAKWRRRRRRRRRRRNNDDDVRTFKGVK